LTVRSFASPRRSSKVHLGRIGRVLILTVALCALGPGAASAASVDCGSEAADSFANEPDLGSSEFRFALGVQVGSLAKDQAKERKAVHARALKALAVFLRHDNPYWWQCAGGEGLFRDAFGDTKLTSPAVDRDCIKKPAWRDDCKARDARAKAWDRFVYQPNSAMGVLREELERGTTGDIGILLQIEDRTVIGGAQAAAVRAIAKDMASMYQCASIRATRAYKPNWEKGIIALFANSEPGSTTREEFFDRLGPAAEKAVPCLTVARYAFGTLE